MASFASFMSSLGRQPQQVAVSPEASRSQPGGKAITNKASNSTDLKPTNTAAGIKRKSADTSFDSASKAARLGSNSLPKRSTGLEKPHHPSVKSSTPTRPTPSSSPYRAAAKTNATTHNKPDVSKPVSKLAGAAVSNSSVTANDPNKPLRGFAAMMAKAQAGYQATVAAGPSRIKHKPVEKLTRRDREKLKQEQVAQQKAGKRPLTQGNGAPPNSKFVEAKGGTGKAKATETGYKGTMKTSGPTPLTYTGTMRKIDPSAPRPKPARKKGEGQDKYGGYASWSDLDDADDGEDDAAEDYDSDVSSDMEGGYEDLAREEAAGLRAAQQEDRQALEEEERHKREKLERKRRLEQLSKSAAARKKF